MNYLTSIIIIIIISHYNVIAKTDPLLSAIVTNDRSTARGIIANPKTNVNEKINSNVEDTKPLKLAIEYGRTDIIKYLLDRKDIAINEPFHVGTHGNLTPLQLAFTPTQKEVIKTLLTSANIDLNVQIDGKPLLKYILITRPKDYLSIIKAILAHKNFRVSMLYQKDSKGRTPIYWAKKTKNDEVIKLFTDKEASMNKDNTSKNIRLLSSSNKLSSTKKDYTSITHSPSKVELDSTYYKRRNEFLNKPEKKQEELKTTLVLDYVSKLIPSHIKWDSLNIDEKCVFMWTTNAYTRIKEALKEDDNNELNYWIPCIAGVVNYLKRTENKQIITYRGAQITMEQLKLYKLYSQEKTLVTVPTMLSTSISEQSALEFAHAPEPNIAVLFVVSVPANIEAAYIEKLSLFRNEKELLLKPYTVFKVKKYSSEDKPHPYIYVEIVDCRKNNCIKAVKSSMG